MPSELRWEQVWMVLDAMAKERMQAVNRRILGKARVMPVGALMGRGGNSGPV